MRQTEDTGSEERGHSTPASAYPLDGDNGQGVGGDLDDTCQEVVEEKTALEQADAERQAVVDHTGGKPSGKKNGGTDVTVRSHRWVSARKT